VCSITTTTYTQQYDGTRHLDKSSGCAWQLPIFFPSPSSSPVQTLTCHEVDYPAMASFSPYTFIQCPCHDTAENGRAAEDQTDNATATGPRDDDVDDNTFDPRSPRSNYSLYPLEYLLYCDVCQQIRCPRCVTEELVNIYCPNCLFEVATSSLKTEGNRCVEDTLKYNGSLQLHSGARSHAD